MMTQEECVEGTLALQRQGKTIKEIGDELGYHPATVSKWLKSGGSPPARAPEASELLIDDRRAARIRELTRPPAEKLSATSVHGIIKAEGFTGSYPTVARHLRELRGQRFRATPALERPNYDRSGRGGPVRLVRVQGLDAALKARGGVLVRCNIVLEPLEDLVVHHLPRRRAHL